jgi:PST family polysaccharide transporter
MSTSARIAHAVAWNVVAGVGARLVGLIGTLILARFITPDDYGQVSVAAICVMTASQFSNLQVGQYLILKGQADRSTAFLVTVVHLGLGLVALSAVFALRDVLGPLMGAPDMGRFVPGFVLAAVFERIGHTPEKLLARDLQFRKIALTRGVGELTYTGLALLWAPHIGGMAIVVGNIGRSLLAMAVFAAAADRQWVEPVRISWHKAVAMLRYSTPLALANLTDFAAGKWDNLLISRFHGPAVAGAYNLSFNLSLTATGTLADQILDVLFPSFTSLPPPQRGAALVRALSSMALLVMPLALGLGSVADTVVAALFPQRWAGIGPMLTVLSVQSALLPLAWTLHAFWRAQSRTGVVMASSGVRLAILLGALLAIGPFGALWACLAVDASAVGCLLTAWWALKAAHRAVMWPAAKSVLQSLLACVPMLACVLAMRVAATQWWALAAPWALALEIAAGAVGYFAGASVFANATFREVMRLATQLVASRFQIAPARPSADA